MGQTGGVLVERARYLVSARGRAALAAAPPGLEQLPPQRLADALRRDLPPEEAAAVAEQVTLHARTRDRLGDDVLLLSAEGAEMMTHPLVAGRRAARLVTLDLPVADLTAGLGGDLRACLAEGILAAGVERDEATALLAGANTSGRVVRGDALHPPFRLETTAVVVDPSRRGARGRRFDPEAFSPPWEACVELARGARAGVIKGPPGIDHRYLPEKSEAEFVQLGRTLREAAIWMGEDCVPGLRRAVLLPSGATISSDDNEADLSIQAPGAFVLDPESCVTRAGLVRQLAARTNGSLMDPQLAYITTDDPVNDPLGATFEVLEVMPFSVAKLKRRLRERHWRVDEIRRRAFPVEPDELRRLLGKNDGAPVALLCTTLLDKRTVIIGQRLRRA